MTITPDYLRPRVPTSSDSLIQGYFAGKTWLDESTGKLYRSDDDSPGAAIWTDISPPGPGSVAWTDVTGKPATFPPSAHAHGSANDIPVLPMSKVDSLEPTLTAKAEAAAVQSQLDSKESLASKGQVNGYAGLGADGKVPSAQLPPLGGEAFPIGSVFLSVVATNPSTLLGYGTWTAIASGRMLVGLDSSDPDFDTVENTGGSKTHTLTEAEMPAHVHRQQRHATASGSLSGVTTAPDTSSSNPQAWGVVDTQSAGGGQAHNNLPPFFVIHIWKRVS